MGDIVNLRRARKRAGREAADKKAGDNRLAFGLPKSTRAAARRDNETALSRIEGHRLSGSQIEAAPGDATSPDVTGTS